MEKEDENNAARPRTDVLYLKDEGKEGQTFPVLRTCPSFSTLGPAFVSSFQIVQHLQTLWLLPSPFAVESVCIAGVVPPKRSRQ